jgi:hypothetical protein
MAAAMKNQSLALFPLHKISGPEKRPVRKILEKATKVVCPDLSAQTQRLDNCMASMWRRCT